jgi:Tfp pilus assembly protein PilF
MASKAELSKVWRTKTVQVLSGRGQEPLTANAIRSDIGIDARHIGAFRKVLRTLQQEGVLNVVGDRYELATDHPEFSTPSQAPSWVSTSLFEAKSMIPASLILAAIVALAFFPGLDGEFLSWDDATYVVNNSRIRDLNWQTLGWAFTSFDAGNWHPVTWLSLAVDYHFYGTEPFGYHLTSLGLHVINSVLVFWVFYQLTGALGRSLALAFLFGLHPLRVESVVWVAERKDVLSTFFWLLTMAAYIRYVRIKTVANYLLVALMFTLGLMSKPVLVTLPAALLLLDYWPFGRLSWKSVAEKVPLLAVSATSLVLTFLAQQAGGAVSIDPIPLLARVANSIVSYVQYLILTIWPQNLSPWYSHPALEGPGLESWQVLGAIAILVGITLLLVFWGRDKRYLAVGWFWYLGTLVPMIGIVQVGRQGMADRYTYIPHIGLFLLLVWGVAGLGIWKSDRLKALGISMVLAIMAALATLTWRQSMIWQDNLSFWSTTAQRSPYSFVAHQGLGLQLRRLKRYDEAYSAMQKASALRPEITRVHSMLGELATRKKDNAAALIHYRKAVALDPGSALNHYRLGETLRRIGQLKEAQDEFKKALSIDPQLAVAHYNLGLIWLSQRRPDLAATSFRAALEAKPNYSAARRALNIALSQIE